MKLILLLVSLSPCLLVSRLIAAEPVVVVKSATEVVVDGNLAGKPADTIRNRPELASAIQTALEKWDKERSAVRAEAQKAIDQTKALLEAVTKDDKAAIAAALKTDKQRRKDEAQAKLDAAKKELEEASK